MTDPLAPFSIAITAFNIYNKLNSQFELNKIKKSITVIDNNLNILNAKSDQVITKEIKSAFDAINDALYSNNNLSRENRLKFAEVFLLKNTRLNPTLETEGRGNNIWIAFSNFGLSYICFLRNDQRLAARHLLKVFVDAPRMARKELAKDIFESIFEPNCRDINFDIERRKQIENKNKLMDIENPEGFIIQSAVLGAAIFVGECLPFGWGDNCKDYAEEKSAELYKNIIDTFLPDDERYERLIDERCSKLAQSHLENLFSETDRLDPTGFSIFIDDTYREFFSVINESDSLEYIYGQCGKIFEQIQKRKLELGLWSTPYEFDYDLVYHIAERLKNTVFNEHILMMDKKDIAEGITDSILKWVRGK